MDPASDSAAAETDSLDQLPAATQSHMGVVCNRIRSFAEGALAELVALERSFVVSFFLPMGACERTHWV